MWSETVSLWPWLQDRGIVKPAKLWIYLVVSVRTLLLCGNTRALTSLSLWDTTFCTVPCAGSRRTHPWASQCCVEEKDQLAGGATIADTFDFLPDTHGTGTRRFWQAGAVGWRNTEATGSGRARAECAGEGRSGAALHREERGPRVDVQVSEQTSLQNLGRRKVPDVLWHVNKLAY